jgi:adenylate cyclase
MTTEKVKRKLTAILSADVKGYSRLMGADEVGTIRILETYRGVMSDLIRKKGGRVVDSPGDNVLAEFASVVDALESAVQIQKELKVRNADRSESRRMEFRIGINLGDVVEEGERIYGDGVNIAARIEGLAEGGGICISGTAFDHIGKRLPLGYEHMGEQAVKNIEKPVRVYRVLMEPEQAGKVIGEKGLKRTQWRWAVAAVALLVLVAGALVWNFYGRPPKIEPASKEKMAFPLPAVPSIAVLPFVNMSGDPNQEFLSDGITEEIITVLSKLRNLFVISRQSTFSYKGKPVKVKQVSEELGVRYVMEGSVQRSGDRIRINAQLIDALTGRHIWAERYERPMGELFALQDEITMKILTAIQVKVTEGEQGALYGKWRGKESVDCYLKVLEGFKIYHGWNIEASTETRRIAEETLAICPEAPGSYLLMASVHLQELFLGIGKSPQESAAKGIEMAQRAIGMDDSMADAYGILALLYTLIREYDKAIAEAERGVALAPGGAWAHHFYAMVLRAAGRSEEAIPIFQKVIRLDPGGTGTYYVAFGDALRDTGRYEEAVSAFKKALQSAPDDIIAHVLLTGTYSLMGREKEARAEAAEVLRINPKFSLENFAPTITFKDQARTDLILDALRKAGLK